MDNKQNKNLVNQYYCPECSGVLRVKSGKYGQFLGCSRFPVCVYTMALKANGEPMETPADNTTREMRNTIRNMLFKWFDPTTAGGRAEIEELMVMITGKKSVNVLSREDCEKVITRLQTTH